MGYQAIFSLTVFLSIVFLVPTTIFAEIDVMHDINFLQSGLLTTKDNKFQISNDLNVREFHDGKIIRVAGQTIEGFPYITYSIVSDSLIKTFGKIFINDKFYELVFSESSEKEIPKEKKDNLAILVKYSQRVYSESQAGITVKIYDPLQNRQSNFEQNYGMINNVNVSINVKDGEKILFSDKGVTNEQGIFVSKFIMPKDTIKPYIIIINAETDDSKSSKILQMFNLGPQPKFIHD